MIQADNSIVDKYGHLLSEETKNKITLKMSKLSKFDLIRPVRVSKMMLGCLTKQEKEALAQAVRKNG